MPHGPLTLLLEFDDQVRRDQTQTALFLHRRDRRYALDCLANQQRPGIAGWLDHVQTRVPATSRPDHNSRLKPWRRLTLLLTPVGALLGMLTMLGLLFYDGNQQINVTVIIGFVALQLLLAVLTTGQALVGWRPWGKLLSSVPRGEDSKRSQIHPMLAQLQPQLAACTAHQMALAFAVAGWLTLIAMVVVQDLAFGWSTTLRTSADAYTGIVQGLAAPWANWLPSAVPSLTLVELTQFFRLSDAVGDNPARYGDWWPFVAMLWLTYAIVPRLLLLVFARLHLRFQARRLLRSHPGRQSLLHRFATPTLDTGSDLTDSGTAPAAPQQQELHALPAGDALVCWAGAGSEVTDIRTRLQQNAKVLVLQAGGTASLNEDQQTIAQLAQHDRPAIILCRAWEPPTGELADFIRDTRQQGPANRVIALLPVGGETPLSAASDIQSAQWLRFVERQQDANLWVCALPAAPSAEARHG